MVPRLANIHFPGLQYSLPRKPPESPASGGFRFLGQRIHWRHYAAFSGQRGCAARLRRAAVGSAARPRRAARDGAEPARWRVFGGPEPAARNGGAPPLRVREARAPIAAQPQPAHAQRARQLRRSRNAAPVNARSALTSEARGSRAERAPAVGASAKTPSALCWRPGARRMTGAARAKPPRQQPGQGATRAPPLREAAGAGASGQPVMHGRRPLTMDMRLRTN